MSYEQYIPLFGGWYLGISAPLADCTTDLNLTLVNRDASSPGDLTSYFAGYYYSETTQRAQAKLDYNRFDVYSNQRGGISQIDLKLRKKIISSRRIAINLSAYATVPTIEPSTANHLCAPTLASNGHWRTGASVSAELIAWKRTTGTLSVQAQGYAGYTFGASEERVLSIRNTLDVWPFGHYSLLANSSATAHTPLQPAANLLTKRMTITPGISHELSGSVSWRGKQLQIDAGYIYHARQAESGGSWQWEENRFALAGSAYDTSTPFASQKSTENALVTLTESDGKTHTHLRRSDLSLDKALLPACHGHTLWSEMRYHTRMRILPLSACAGIAATVAGSGWLGQNISAWASFNLEF